ncbi:pyridoxal phosphate-dependent aminotransferase [Alkalithermobacter paradoxus]|uniref:Aminotransferase n=1 Tax=Alkalithermobacter paradoxus TaxID=29349 RepID=A0A1V4IBE2_9FIRM|nr:aspartate aminotransferase [[Clostridium] thermoalcaliphilum]
MKFSRRITTMQASPIRKLVPYATKAKSEGKKVYHLNIGQPDIKTPQSFFDAVKNFNEEVLEYSFSQGMPELIDAIRDYYKNYNMDFDKDEILITNGGSEALMFAIIAIADAGDEIIAPEPFYTNYNGFASAVDVNILPITTKAEDGFHLPSKSEIENVITPRTRGIMLSNPGNPTGVVYTKEEIEMVASIAKEHNLFIIADEVYREFVYDGLEYTSFGNVKDVEDRVIIVDSVSKRYSACGARIGSIASKNKELMNQILKLCQGRLCVPTLEQVGAVELYKTDESYFEEVNQEYKKRRDIVYKKLSEIDGVVCKEPKGAFYVVAKLPVENAEDFVIWMLRDFDLNGETVMMAPAEGFYSTPGLGKDEVRLAYILNEDDLTKAMEVLKKGLETYINLNK